MTCPHCRIESLVESCWPICTKHQSCQAFVYPILRVWMDTHVSAKTVFSSNQSETSSGGKHEHKVGNCIFCSQHSNCFDKGTFRSFQSASFCEPSEPTRTQTCQRTVLNALPKNRSECIETYFHDAWTSKNEHLSEKYFFPKQMHAVSTLWKWTCISFSIENQKLACLEVTLFRTSNASLGSVKWSKLQPWLRNLLKFTERIRTLQKNHLQIDEIYRKE